MTLILLGITLLLSAVVVTLSVILHLRDGAREWYALLAILDVLLVFSPITMRAGIGFGLEVMALFAAVSSLIALISTFFVSRADVGG